MKIIKIVLLVFIISLLFLNFSTVLAGESVNKSFNSELNNSAQKAGFKIDNKKITKTDIAKKIGRILGIFMSLIGLLFMVIIFIGAFDIISAGGNEEQLQRGKKKIKNGGIGVLIMFMSYVLVQTVLTIIASGGAFST